MGSRSGTLRHYSQKNMPRIKRTTARPTPKGAAARCVTHSWVIVQELSRARTKFIDSEKFAYRFNDFLRAGRAALAVLPKEKSVRAPALPGKPTLPEVVKTDVAQLTASDSRFKHFVEMKDVSAHDVTVKPDRTDTTVTLVEGLRMKSSVGLVSAGAEGEIAERRETSDATAPELPRRRVKVSVRYFLNDWPTEDLFTYCREILKTLDSLVQSVYRKFP